MKNLAEKLAECEQIIEWVDPRDVRLRIATGEPAPNSGGDVRDEWTIDPCDEERLASEIYRLIMPKEHVLRGMARAVFARDAYPHEGKPGYGNVVMTLSDDRDWHDIFPTDRTQVYKRKGRRAWAAVGICSNEMGLAVFSKELPDGGIQARIQRVPNDVLDKINGV